VSTIIHIPALSVESSARYESGSKLAGVIYIHRISDKRFTGIAGRNFKMFRELCGDSTLKNVILVTNMWGEVTKEVGEAREEQLTTNFFKPVLDKSAQLARHQNTVQSAHDIIRRIMRNQPLVLQIQRELVDEHKDIVDTAAGEAVNKELNEQIRHHQAELKTVQEEMQKALKEKDEETRKELEEETRKLQEQMNKIKMDSEGMASNYLQEKKRTEDAVREMQEQARLERERVEAEYKKQMNDLKTRLQESANAAAVKREEMQKRGDGKEHVTGNSFKSVLGKGAQPSHHHNAARDIIRRILKDRPIFVDETFYVEDRRHQAELKALREEGFQALKERDEVIRRELYTGIRCLQEQMKMETRHLQEQMKMETRHLQERMEMELGQMASNHEEEKRRTEAAIRRVQEEARVERELLLARLS
jgi:hypothetical protein